MDPRICGNIPDPCGKLFLNIFTVGRMVQVAGLSAQIGPLLHQVGFVALTGQAFGCGHPRDSAADHQGGLMDIQLDLLERLHQTDFRHRHPNQVFGFFRGKIRIMFVHPRVLVADVCHFEKIFVEPGVDQGFLKQGFMGFRRAGGHDNPIQSVFRDDPAHGLLGILGAGIEVIGHILHVGQTGRIIPDRFHIHHSGDIDAAFTDKDAHPRAFSRDIGFGYRFLGPCQRISRRTQYLAGRGRGRTGVDHGLGNIFGPLKGAAGIHPVHGGGHRIERSRFTEIALRQFDTEPPG